MTGFRARELSSTISRALSQLPVVIVTGPRQAGKSTLLKEDPAFRGRAYLSLDDYATLEAARRDPQALLAGDDPLTIDEAQRCPELLLEIKRSVDRRRVPGRFLLSGSASFSLLRRVTETLAGRAVYLALHPFSRRERSGLIEERPFLLRFFDEPGVPRAVRVSPVTDEQILNGGMPPVALHQVTDRHWWFLGYEQTYLERDVRDLSRIADMIPYRNFLRLSALRTGRILNQSELARDAKVSNSTASRYLSLLEASFIVSRVPPFLRNRSSRVIKSPKLYVVDSGIACHMAGIEDSLSDDTLRGALHETYVAQNLGAIVGAHRPRMDLCFWHVQGRHEVDFVLSHGRESVAIEVKASSRFEERDLSGLRAFRAMTRGVRALVLAYNGAEAVSLGDGVYAIPMGLLLA